MELNGAMWLNFVAMANEIKDLVEVKVDVVPKRSIKRIAQTQLAIVFEQYLSIGIF